ncbi:MAG: DUF190 domain-containing protein [Sedimenticola sp.]|uniref:DUF190 domain-containing protein n=1 Tax=Sedimenticola thiotaurini TaxID=1543721 RepID=A0A558CU44_9GAMM|nr:DUF190 domain-containing protein [Sedimenticola sp.]TVT52280.1 MAG: DUF190 domain-containing protein [Sedimenticola thiotaurini]MCW8920453.1 DUF190 domain-containing protein [Sedimenticola sp.]MCW8947523.1 DUF190 domain-containing protein [Sedimenticola sp.]MCW8948953.1 DUF190 domain-containing protein [Sedimenticola sp.]
MKSKPVTMVRIYLTEGMHQYKEFMELLHDQEQVAGVTAFRGITGFGKTGKIHSSTLIDMSLDLPIVLEFFDEPEKVATVLKQLNSLIKPGHIVSWPAYVNSGE